VTLDPEHALRILERAERVCSAAEVAAAIERLAGEISAALSGAFPLVLCVMRGGAIFAGKLLPRLRFPLEFDYLDVRRYGVELRGGRICWRASPETPVAGRVVLVLDDILDEGETLAAVRERLLAEGASRVVLAVLAEKRTGRPKALAADHVGVQVPDRYVFGCGMDVRGLWRNLPEIYALAEDERSR
jgi:hypoxanthine phosphoribosyltransferase